MTTVSDESTGKLTDGYHTFEELYEHRHTLWIALCKAIKSDPQYQYFRDVWRSKVHSDGSSWCGWFVLGIGKESGYQMTYHLPTTKWDLTDFAETLDRAPEFDGHTSADVLKRIAGI